MSLQQAAGVEAHFSAFVRAAAARHPRWTHGWLNPARSIHPFVRAELDAALVHTIAAKYGWGVRLPAKPASIRAWHCRRALRAAGTDVVLVWNRSARIGYVLDALGASRCIHWEHGAAWHRGHERDRAKYFRSVPLAIANSRASARVLELLWDYRGDVRVCSNALRPALRPRHPVGKPYPQGAIKLGVAARLYPVKGVALALHAAKLLVADGMRVELEIAGEGPELSNLQALARSLGLESICRFRGALREMSRFYAEIDCLVHAPLTEAFGLVAIEAAAHGCPVIAAAVDGLPEAVADGVTGRCLTPELPLEDYAKLGGSFTEVPAYIYDPAADALREPRLVDPAALATAVRSLFAHAATFETTSAAAAAHVATRFDFATHVDEVVGVIDAFVRSTGGARDG